MALERAGDDPWAGWWGTLAAGQAGGAEALAGALAAAREAPADGPDGREVARRLDDLAAEVAALSGDGAADARFAVLGHRARPRRRVLLADGRRPRSSSSPAGSPCASCGWAPPRARRSATAPTCPLPEVIAAIRRGEAGPGWDVPDDRPADLDPEAMLGALREDPAARDRRLVRLAQEVAEERERLIEERAALAEERASMAAERARRRRVRPVPPPSRPSAARRGPAAAQRRRGRRPARAGARRRPPGRRSRLPRRR